MEVPEILVDLPVRCDPAERVRERFVPLSAGAIVTATTATTGSTEYPQRHENRTVAKIARKPPGGIP